MNYPHKSGLEHAHDRTSARPNTKAVVAREGQKFYNQGAELNEIQSIADIRFQQVGGMTARNGDRISGCDIIVDEANGQVIMGAGEIYLNGHVLPIEAATLTGVAMAGLSVIGCRLHVTYVTEDEDDSLLGLEPGTAGEGEPGAAREEWRIVWATLSGAAIEPFTRVYTLSDGDPLENSAPPVLSGVREQIAQYDRVNNGNFIAKGCLVRAIGLQSGEQVFVIGAGRAHINGYQNSRTADLRFSVTEEWSTELVEAETHQYADVGGQCVLTVSQPPIDSVVQVLVTKQRTETIARGPVSNSTDALAENSVKQIISVVSGGTTYVKDVDYKLTNNQVDWSLGGAEPSGGQSYDATYHYWDSVTPVASGSETITVSGGVEGQDVQLEYKSKLPRFDVLGLNSTNEPVYIKGVSSRFAPKSPPVPADILPLATVQNYFDGTPTIVQEKFYRVAPHELFWRLFQMFEEMQDVVATNRLQTDIHMRDPVAKSGYFVDPFTSDRFRDQGELTTAAAVGGVLRLPVDETLHPIELPNLVMLDYTESILAVQDFKTGCMKINPYQNFDPLPAAMSITPAADFWVVEETQWTSPVTSVFNLPVMQIVDARRAQELGFDGRRAGQLVTSSSSETTELFEEREERIRNLREIQVDFTINGFGNGEILQSLFFDGQDVTPAGPLTADANGAVSGNFMIPAGLPSGRKAVIATGGSGAEAEALFVGEGRIDIDVMRRINTIERQVIDFRPPPTETESERRRRRDRERRREERRQRRDPLAQIFYVNTDKHIVGIDVQFCEIGNIANDVIVEMVRAENGTPTADVIDQVVLKMGAVTAGEWTPVRFKAPPFTQMVDQFAFVFKTNDATHALAVAKVGDFDADKQQHVTAQPYTSGTLLSSSDAMTWLPHPDMDLMMRIVVADFAPQTKSIELGSFNLTAATDLLARVAVDLPNEDTSFYLELERANGDRMRMDPDQPHEFDEYVTEQVKLHCIMSGSLNVSPTLFPQAMLVEGKIRETADYISRAFDMGDIASISARLKTFLPGGSTVTVSVDKADDNWIVMGEQAAQNYGDNWSEKHWKQTGHTTPNGRIKIEMTGGPAARPLLQDLRATSSII